MSNGPGPPLAPDLDVDGFPLFPALPGSRRVTTAARSLARLVAGLRTGVIAARTASLSAMVVFLEREPIDGLAVRDGERVTGPDVLDEIADVPLDQVAVIELRPELAAVVGSYFLPTSVRGVPASVLDPDTFIRSLARPGQRGCVLVKGPDAIGLVFVDGGRVRLAYRQGDEDLGGLEKVASLMDEPETTIWARVGPATAAIERPMSEPVERHAPPPEPITEPEPEPEPPPHALEQPAVSGWAAPDPAAVTAATAAAEELAASHTVPEDADLLEVVLAEVRHVLGQHAVRVEGVFRAAEPTPEGLCAAARSLRERRLRLFSQATVDLLATRVIAVLGH